MRSEGRDLLTGCREVCIVLLTGIGDVVHGLPVAIGLKRALPGIRVTWIAEPAPAEVVRPHPAVDEVIVFHKSEGWRGIERLRRDLAGRRFDVTLNLQRYFKSVWPTLLSAAPRRIGLDRARTRDGVWLASTHRVPPRPWRHTQDVFLEFLDLLEIPRPEPLTWDLALTPAERAAQHAFYGALGSAPCVVLALASANPVKDWTVEGYAGLVDLLAAAGHTVVLTGGPSGRERRMAGEISQRAALPPIDARQDSVRRLMWVLEGADVVVSPDSGPLHLAHAFGTPVVGLYGHTNPARCGPYLRFRDLVVDCYTPPGAQPDPRDARVRNGVMPTIRARDVAEKVELALRRYGKRDRGEA